MTATLKSTAGDGRVALVTGGGRGIGAAIVQRLSRDGTTVAFTYSTSEDAANHVVQDLAADGRRGLAIRADAADPAAVVEGARPARLGAASRGRQRLRRPISASAGWRRAPSST